MSTEAWVTLLAVLVSAAVGGYGIYRSVRADRETDRRRHRADLKIRLERDPDQIVLRNAGLGIAADIQFEVTTNVGGRSPIERDARRKLPLATLGTGEECRFIAMIAWEIETALNCVISWRDIDGGRRHEEIVLHV